MTVDKCCDLYYMNIKLVYSLETKVLLRPHRVLRVNLHQSLDILDRKFNDQIWKVLFQRLGANLSVIMKW